ncbi:hypothetical protein CB0940_05077 [Cercospora beticola]|uniref:F-box domain-containing protein n=1 Tax=Cercospora beticola TaxID=122368 RepID=A0A2G5HMZ6_CERBT|nr:hypothetical protein CB0940_05077 [Cercospora beticola]PIA93939.1 hypothetical protein CB0940_05077 [Cercospora beticola]WPB02377.1 hypothetical protein RHO25_007011 [Cercospora beticola]CAK1362737.1 unnamed protein product [Cercospora beticola]
MNLLALFTKPWVTQRTPSSEVCNQHSTASSSKLTSNQPLLDSDLSSMKTNLNANAINFSSHLDLPSPKQQHAAKKYAKERILANPKALDRFFDYLSLADLLTCQRVCKSWSHTITFSRKWKEQLYLAPASGNHGQQTAKLNPFLTTISSTISELHQIYDNLPCDTMTPLLQEDHSIVFAWKGRYYRPQTFFSRSSNPALSSVSSAENVSAPYIEWQLRELSRYEICSLNNSTLFPGPNSSIWKMYLCQPPPIEIHITVWEMDNAYEDDSRLPKAADAGHITERFVLKAWTIREIFERMDEARDEERKARRPTHEEQTPKRKMEKFRHLFINDKSQLSPPTAPAFSTSFHNTSQCHLPPTPTPSPLRPRVAKILAAPETPPEFPSPKFPNAATSSAASTYSKPASISSLASNASLARKKVQQVLRNNASTMTVGLGGYVEPLAPSGGRKAD